MTDRDRLAAAFALLEERAPRTCASPLDEPDRLTRSADRHRRSSRFWIARHRGRVALAAAAVVATSTVLGLAVTTGESHPPAARTSTPQASSIVPVAPLGPAAGPGRNVAARATVFLNGSPQLGHSPVPVTVGDMLRFALTITPHPGTELGNLYIVIAGYGPQSNAPDGAPTGDFTTLAHDPAYSYDIVHRTVTWTPPASLRGREVQLSLIYLVRTPTAPTATLIEQWPLSLDIRR